MLRYMTDRRRPCLIAFYDIRPGNGVGIFLQPGTRTGDGHHLPNGISAWGVKTPTRRDEHPTNATLEHEHISFFYTHYNIKQAVCMAT